MDETLDFAAALPWTGPAIGLLDLDAFFASVEELDNPQWRGLPIIVGSPDGRSVVSTASYEARKYGVHSAMPSAQAKRLCPEGIWVKPRFSRYQELSHKVMEILERETPLVEQVSIDEAFFDITPGRFSCESPILICKRIQDSVAALGVTCSIGISTTKSVSKIASEVQKPRGLTFVLPGSEQSFLQDMPVRALSGIGPATEARLRDLGIRTLGELGCAQEHEVERVLGANASVMIARARGVGDGDVRASSEAREVKSVSNERTFDVDLVEADEIREALIHVSGLVGRRLRAKELTPHTVSIKIRYEFEHTVSAQMQLKCPANDDDTLISTALALFEKTHEVGRGIRLLGVGASGFDPDDVIQRSLEDAPRRSDDVSKALDDIRQRFGDAALSRGSELKHKGRQA